MAQMPTIISLVFVFDVVRTIVRYGQPKEFGQFTLSSTVATLLLFSSLFINHYNSVFLNVEPYLIC